MLQIKDITKEYQTGELVQKALNGVSLNFRDSEFVSILGPSGSGKTTLLNIVGGLDRYDSGDLVINNVSTKNYKDRDWDSYRNHTIGFVFQSYNLIPHQTVLANVELALTIGGISKRERKKRALKALAEVGLRDQAHKRPNQMSGGQMQRVAIARALVNNPDILLADEPTGALDTETSVQVMQLLKEVAKDRLVIMVTHNPELAEEYSTRIVKLRDGKIIDDTDPFIVNEKKLKKPQHKNLGKASMAWTTALSLSFNNLLTKKGRTILTAFAGSIGIIGIALILALSTGFQNYIDKIQEDTLTSYPLTVTRETMDMASALLSMASQSGEEKDGNVVEEQQYISTMFAEIGTNDLKSLKNYLEKEEKTVNDMVTMVRYQYSIVPYIYTRDANGDVAKLNPSSAMEVFGGSNSMTSMMPATSSSIFYEMMDDEKTLKDEYNVLAGRWPERYDEVLLVLPEPNGMPDLLVYALGLRPIDEMQDMLAKVMSGETVDPPGKALDFTYEELMELPFKLVEASDMYKYNSEYDVYEDMSGDEEFMEDVYEDSMDLKMVGIVCAKKSSSMSLSPGLAYTKDLTEYIIDRASTSEIVKKQQEDRDINVFSGKRFDDDSEDTGLDFQDMVTIDEEKIASAFGGNISEEQIKKMTEGYMKEISSSITADTSKAAAAVNDSLAEIATDMMSDYAEENMDTVSGMAMMPEDEIEDVINEYMSTNKAQKPLKDMESEYLIPASVYTEMYKEILKATLQGAASQTGGMGVPLNDEIIQTMVTELVKQNPAQAIAPKMVEAVMQKNVLTKVGELTGELMGTMAEAFQIDMEAFGEAFQFNMEEDEIARLMQSMSTAGVEKNADTNLTALGYQDLEEPSMISFYFKDFEAKEKFVDFLDDYNERMEKEDEEKVVKYTDLTGILMSSVKTIVDSVSYVLIAFVSISLIVSSIMIGIITYISVLERTKEIGVLRAIGASKKNISSIFNAETFIVGLFSGMIGIGFTLAVVPIINKVIHNVSGNTDINAVLPVEGATILVILSVVLTLISGLIPSRQAAKKDPVLALRSE